MSDFTGQWHVEDITPDLLQVERIKGIVFSGRTAYQSVQILETVCFGKTLVLDGKTQSAELDEFVYHEALVQPPLTVHPRPETVFIAGGGEGATLRETLSHDTVRRVVMVDIDQEVVDLCRQHLPRHHQGAFDDPRAEVHFTDAYRFLEETKDSYDVIVIDVPDPLEAGPAYLLFTREFYELARGKLRPQGVLVAQAGHTGPAYMEQCFASVAHTMGTVFPTAYIYEAFIPCFGSTWGFVMGSIGPDPLALDGNAVDSVLSKRLSKPLRYYDGVTHRGMFSPPKYLREKVASESRIITRDNPLYVP